MKNKTIIKAAGLLSGNHNINGSFNNRGTNGNFWSSSENGSNAWYRNLNSSNAGVNRNKKDVVKFEVNYERNLFVLAEEILDGKYQPGVSSCFIVKKPVKREIFAASFRDRIVHHLIYNYINPLFERSFINDSYSCRIGKGTSYGIKRLNHFIRSCSENYQKDCYILKLDIKGYFMSINKNILHEKIKETLNTARERERERERE